MSRFFPPRSDLLLAGLVAVAALLLLVASHQPHAVLPLVVALLFPLGTWRLRHDLGLISHVLGLAVPLGLSFALKNVEGLAGNRFHGSFHGAAAGLLLAAIQLQAVPSPRRSAWVLLGTGGCIAAAAIGLPAYIGGVGWEYMQPGFLARIDPQGMYAAACGVWGVLALQVMRGEVPALPNAPRRGRAVAVLAASALAGALTLLLVLGVRATYEDLTNLWFRMVDGAPLRTAGGFSDQARLGSLSDEVGPEAQAIALRAFAPTAPGYLRGRTFHTYERGRWVGGPTVARELARTGRWLVLPGREAPPEGEAALEVHPDSEYGAHFFLPLEAAALETACEQVSLHSGGTLRTLDRPTSDGYAVWLAGGDAPLLEEQDAPAWLQVPDKDPELLAALDEVIAAEGLQGLAPEEVVSRLTRWFDRTYRYKVGIQFRPGTDPLVQWLREHRTGHCELFASAGTLLLRRLGIRARYVTGFICFDRHPWEDDVWVARRQHAHAWVEWLHPRRGWLTADPTPTSGIAGPAQPSTLRLLSEWIGTRWARISSALKGGLASVPGALLRLLQATGAWLVGAWWRLPLLVLPPLAWWLRRRWRARRRAAPAVTSAPLPPEVEADRRRFLALEARLRKAGLGRAPHDTLLEYAARLEAAPALPPGVERASALALIRSLAQRRYAVPRL